MITKFLFLKLIESKFSFILAFWSYSKGYSFRLKKYILYPLAYFIQPTTGGRRGDKVSAFF